MGHDWGGPTAFALAAQHRDAVKRLAIFDVPVPGDGTPVMFANRWHHGLHWELDFPEALTAGREDVYLGFFYRNWGGRPDAISRDAEREYLRAYRQPGAMRAGFNLYRATPQDVADNQAFLSEGKLKMPVLCYSGALGRGTRWVGDGVMVPRRRRMSEVASLRIAATGSRKNVRDGLWSSCWLSLAKRRPKDSDGNYFATCQEPETVEKGLRPDADGNFISITVLSVFVI